MKLACHIGVGSFSDRPRKTRGVVKRKKNQEVDAE